MTSLLPSTCFAIPFMANGTIPSSLSCNDYLISGNTLRISGCMQVFHHTNETFTRHLSPSVHIWSARWTVGQSKAVTWGDCLSGIYSLELLVQLPGDKVVERIVCCRMA